MDMDQFIDLCILLGCDYCPRIPGIGPQKAFDGILKHKTINAFLATLDKTKFKIPEDYPFEEARALFKNPEVRAASRARTSASPTSVLRLRGPLSWGSRFSQSINKVPPGVWG